VRNVDSENLAHRFDCFKFLFHSFSAETFATQSAQRVVSLETTTICNCTDCQTIGAPLRAVIITRLGTFVLLSGKPTEYRKTADGGNVRVQAFCPQCGTAL